MEVIHGCHTNWEKIGDYNDIESYLKKLPEGVPSIDSYDWYGKTLINVVRTPEALEKLIKLGLSPDTHEKAYKRTPAHLGSVDMLKVLAKYNADFNKRDIFGKTPLFYAYEYKDKEKINFLLNNKADPNIKDIHGNLYNFF